ncbi:complement component C8 alpha chain [Discoglossus pictus]
MKAWKGLCSLFLVCCYVISLRANRTDSGDSGKLSSHRREARSFFGKQPPPDPIDCKLNQWSSWSPCYPCQGKKFRYRGLNQPAKYKGRICSGHLWDEIICKTSEKCVEDNKCGLDFQCAETGRCIKKRLVCNGEPDCRDGSDENDCNLSVDETFCRQLFAIPGSEKAVRGFNILTQEEAQNVIDPNYFGGQCEYIYNGEWRELRYDPACEQMYYADDEKYFRKPYNFHVYQFLAHADSGMSYEIYDDSASLLKAIKRGGSSNVGFTFGIAPAGSPVGVEVGLSGQTQREFLNNITAYDAKNLRFIRMATKVQTARYRIRRKSLVLDEDLLQSLMELPDNYDYGLYAKFFNDYGTHFITSGTMGGKLESVLVVDEEIMKKQEITATMLANCIGTSIGLTIPVEDTQAEIELKVSAKKCRRKEDVNADLSASSSAIKDVITHVTGGDIGSSGGVANVFIGSTYRFWGRSLKYNPAVIDFELQPIFEILGQTDLTGIEVKRQNMKRALDEYLFEFNACRCGPCQNNGEPILDNNECICKCPSGFEGPSCEKTTRTDAPADGSWSCWTSWTSCQSGRRQRTRQCNNPPPKNGGVPCLGGSTQAQSC